MKLKLLIIVAFILVICSIVVSAEPNTKENVKWNTISTLSGSIYNSSVVDLHEEDDERKIEPAPLPALDLPSNRVFIITTLSISLIIILGVWSESIDVIHFHLLRKQMKRGSMKLFM